MTYAILTTENRFLQRPGKPELDELQSAVGGYIEARQIGPVTMFMNEHGAITEPPLPVNAPASAMAGLTIRGDVVLTGGPDSEGEVTDLPGEFIERLISAGAIEPA